VKFWGSKIPLHVRVVTRLPVKEKLVLDFWLRRSLFVEQSALAIMNEQLESRREK
jgi:hypothetical protein